MVRRSETGSSRSRPSADASAPADGLSVHWTSSMPMSRGRVLASARMAPSTAAETMRLSTSDASPSLSRSATSSERRCGSGSVEGSSPGSLARRSPRTEKDRSDSDSAGWQERMVMSARDVARAMASCQINVFPIPASPVIMAAVGPFPTSSRNLASAASSRRRPTSSGDTTVPPAMGAVTIRLVPYDVETDGRAIGAFFPRIPLAGFRSEWSPGLSLSSSRRA